jgi:hypothetical protein
MHPYRYDGSPGPYQAMLERLSTMGKPRERGHDPMPGWHDPIPFLGEHQLDAHLYDIRRMAERDQPTLHEDDDLSKTMGAYAITGASSTMHGLTTRQTALEIIEQRAKWLATYLTPERLDVAEQWRDQMARRGAQARQVGEHRMKAGGADRNIRWAIQHGYADSRSALDAWDKLVTETHQGSLIEAAKEVQKNPDILGTLAGGKTWFGLGREDRDRLRARDRLSDLGHHATIATNHGRLADQADRRLKAIDKPDHAKGALAETLAVMREVKRIDLHYMLALQDKVVQARALIAGRDADPVASLKVADRLYTEWRSGDNPGERITATQLRQGMLSTLHDVRRKPELLAELASAGIDPDAVFSEERPKPQASKPTLQRSFQHNAPAP